MSFFALKLSPAHAYSIAACLHHWQQLLPDFRWVHPEDYHLTLRFLGSLSRIEAVELARNMRSSSLPRFELRVRGCTVFDKGERGGVLCAAVPHDAPELLALRNEVEAQLQGLGFAAESRLFTPHVTLSRYERGAREKAAEFSRVESQRDWGVIHAESYQLMKRRSAADPGGPLYESLQQFALREPS